MHADLTRVPQDLPDYVGTAAGLGPVGSHTTPAVFGDAHTTQAAATIGVPQFTAMAQGRGWASRHAGSRQRQPLWEQRHVARRHTESFSGTSSGHVAS